MDRRLFGCFLIGALIVLILLVGDCDFAEARGRSSGGLSPGGRVLFGFLLGIFFVLVLPALVVGSSYNGGGLLLGGISGVVVWLGASALLAQSLGPDWGWLGVLAAPLAAIPAAMLICSRLEARERSRRKKMRHLRRAQHRTPI